MEEILEEGDGLDRLAEPHLVSQDGAGAASPGLDHEVDAVHLETETTFRNDLEILYATSADLSATVKNGQELGPSLTYRKWLQLLLLLATRNLAKVLQEESRFPVFKQTQPRFYIVNPTGTHVHLLNVCHSGRSALSFPLPSSSAMVCPSNLGECSLVRLLFFQNLHWVFEYGLPCLGPEELSGNILVSENCDFFYTISFADFSTLKI